MENDIRIETIFFIFISVLIFLAVRALYCLLSAGIGIFMAGIPVWLETIKFSKNHPGVPFRVVIHIQPESEDKQ